MNIMDIVLPGINFWFLLALLLMAFILGMFAARSTGRGLR